MTTLGKFVGQSEADVRKASSLLDEVVSRNVVAAEAPACQGKPTWHGQARVNASGRWRTVKNNAGNPIAYATAEAARNAAQDLRDQMVIEAACQEIEAGLLTQDVYVNGTRLSTMSRNDIMELVRRACADIGRQCREP